MVKKFKVVVVVSSTLKDDTNTLIANEVKALLRNAGLAVKSIRATQVREK